MMYWTVNLLNTEIKNIKLLIYLIVFDLRYLVESNGINPD